MNHLDHLDRLDHLDSSRFKLVSTHTMALQRFISQNPQHSLSLIQARAETLIRRPSMHASLQQKKHKNTPPSPKRAWVEWTRGSGGLLVHYPGLNRSIPNPPTRPPSRPPSLRPYEACAAPCGPADSKGVISAPGQLLSPLSPLRSLRWLRPKLSD